MKVAIRADGNAKIGMGHLMRCLSIAIALKERQAEVYFLTNDVQSKELIEEKGFLCHLLREFQNPYENESPEVIQFVKNNGIHLVIVDSYFVSVDDLEKINTVVPVFYLDDLGKMDLPVSGLLNYNIYGKSMSYEQHYDESVKLLLGSQYAPVKVQFKNTPYELKQEVSNILITMGGSDALNIAGQLTERLVKVLSEHIQITLICGRFSPHLEQIKEISKKYKQVQVLTDVADMWNVMQKSDLAIAAAGSTMYELCTIGVPTICCYYVENQRRMAETFDRETSMFNAGDFSKNPNEVLEKIVDHTQKLLQSYEFRKVLSEEMKQVSDGMGAERIAKSICDFVMQL